VQTELGNNLLDAAADGYDAVGIFFYQENYYFIYPQLFSNFGRIRPKSLLIVRFMNIGDKITILRKQKNMSQTDLGKAVGVSREIIGRYERNEVLLSIEVAAKIANALEVSMDYLAGNTDQLLEKNIIRRISDIHQLPQDDKAHLFALMDAFLRDHKAKKAYAS